LSSLLFSSLTCHLD